MTRAEAMAIAESAGIATRALNAAARKLNMSSDDWDKSELAKAEKEITRIAAMANATLEAAQTDYRCAVAAKQMYRVPRSGKQARHVRVVSVRGKSGHMPKAHLVEVTRSGNDKPQDHGLVHFVSFLMFRDGAWRLSASYELL